MKLKFDKFCEHLGDFGTFFRTTGYDININYEAGLFSLKPDIGKLFEGNLGYSDKMYIRDCQNAPKQKGYYYVPLTKKVMLAPKSMLENILTIFGRKFDLYVQWMLDSRFNKDYFIPDDDADFLYHA